MDYKTRNRKIIDLPSGAKAQVRALSYRDMLGLRHMVAPNLGGPRPRQTDAAREAAVDDEARLYDLALSRCLAWIEYEGKHLVPATGKPWTDCGEEEISIDEIDQKDGRAIFEAVAELSGFGGEAAQAATFPEAKEPGG